MILMNGPLSFKREEARSSPLLYVGWRSGSEMQQMSSTPFTPAVVEESWMSDTVHAQHISREGVCDLYIGGVGRESAVFYDLHDLAEWLVEHEIHADDPVWMYLEHLANQGDD